MRSSIQIREEEMPDKMMKYAADAGFSEVAIGFGSSDLLMKDSFEARVSELQEMLDKNGLVCKQTHMTCYHLLVSSEEKEDSMERAIINGLKASAQLGAEWTAFHPRTAVNDGYNQKKSFEDNKKALESYLEYAEKYGVGIAVENMPLYPYTHPEWRFFGGGWEELCELCDSFHTDKIGICWDFGHAHTASLDTLAFESIGDRLKITHVHDNYKNGDHHQLPAMGSLEWGCIDWEKNMKALAASGYNGPLTLEVIFPPEPMLKSFIRCGYDSLNYLKSFV